MSAPAATPSAGLLDRSQVDFLLQVLLGSDPRHLSHELPLWTVQELGAVIRDEFDLDYGIEQLGDCLHLLGLAPPAPLSGLEPARRATYMQWLERELPRVDGRPAWPWLLDELPVCCAAHDILRAAPRERRLTALVACTVDGVLAFRLCADAPDLRQRGEFLERLAQITGQAALLACGREDEYIAAHARLPLPVQRMLAVLDPRGAPAAAPAGLFRAEALRARQRRLEGDVLVVQPLPLRLWVGGLAVLLAGLVLFIAFGRFARTHEASGVLMPADGVARVASPRDGALAAIDVAVGDRVEAGQPLARIGSVNVDAGGRAVDAAVVAELERARDALERERESVFAQAGVEQRRLADALASAQRLHANAAEQHAVQQKQQASIEQRLDATRTLAERGVVARVQLQQLEEQALASRMQTLALARERHAAAAAVDEARMRVERQPLDLQQQCAAFEQRRGELDQRLAQARLVAGAIVGAPRAGRVAAVLARPGDGVVAGQPLVLLVDDGAALRAELHVPSRAIGLIRPGQRVDLKLDAYPYQRYGVQRGTVRTVAEAALAPRDLDTGAREPVYVVEVALDRQTIAASGAEQPLRAGMQLQAAIVIDTPSVLDWLLEPLYSLR